LYGRANYGSGPYGETRSAFADLAVAARVMVYDKLGNFKGLFQSGVSTIVSIDFKHEDTGCGEFTLAFSQFVNVAKSDRVKVFLFDSDRCFYTGVVRGVPIEGSTSTVYEYTGFGLNDYFQRINTEYKVYGTTGSTGSAGSLTEIVLDLLDDVIVVKAPILKSMALIDLPDIDVTYLLCNYVTIDSALSALKTIADSTGTEYNYGVDANGYFFFRPRSEALVATLFVGKRGPFGIQNYEPSDEEEQRTKLFVLKNDGTYLTTIISGEDNDTYEERLKGPDVDDDDLLLYAQGYLYQKERATRSASIEWKVEEQSPVFVEADGYVRVVSNVPPSVNKTMAAFYWGRDAWGSGPWGGEAYEGYDVDDTLSVKEIEYSVSNAGATRKLTLGSKPVKLESMIADIYKSLADLEVSIEG
jgi:hypothetical protein